MSRNRSMPATGYITPSGDRRCIVQLDEPTFNEVRAIAQQRGVSFSAAVYALIEEAFAHRRRKTAEAAPGQETAS
jgi:hypothetical protein